VVTLVNWSRSLAAVADDYPNVSWLVHKNAMAAERKGHESTPLAFTLLLFEQSRTETKEGKFVRQLLRLLMTSESN
jgi:hypothetical protein